MNGKHFLCYLNVITKRLLYYGLLVVNRASTLNRAVCTFRVGFQCDLRPNELIDNRQCVKIRAVKPAIDISGCAEVTSKLAEP